MRSLQVVQHAVAAARRPGHRHLSEPAELPPATEGPVPIPSSHHAQVVMDPRHPIDRAMLRMTSIDGEVVDADPVRPQRGSAAGPDAGEPLALRDLRRGVRLVRTGADTVVVLRRPHHAPFAGRFRRAVESAARALRLQFGAGQRIDTWAGIAQRNQADADRRIVRIAPGQVPAYVTRHYDRAFIDAINQPTFGGMAMTCTPACVFPTPAQAHCGACHMTFSGATLFDAHRTGPVDSRVCHDPRAIPGPGGVAIPTRLDARGVWRYDVPRTRTPGRETPTPTE